MHVTTRVSVRFERRDKKPPATYITTVTVIMYVKIRTTKTAVSLVITLIKRGEKRQNERERERTREKKRKRMREGGE